MRKNSFAQFRGLKQIKKKKNLNFLFGACSLKKLRNMQIKKNIFRFLKMKILPQNALQVASQAQGPNSMIVVNLSI